MPDINHVEAGKQLADKMLNASQRTPSYFQHNGGSMFVDAAQMLGERRGGDTVDLSYETVQEAKKNIQSDPHADDRVKKAANSTLDVISDGPDGKKGTASDKKQKLSQLAVDNGSSLQRKDSIAPNWQNVDDEIDRAYDSGYEKGEKAKEAKEAKPEISDPSKQASVSEAERAASKIGASLASAGTGKVQENGRDIGAASSTESLGGQGQAAQRDAASRMA